MQMTALEIGTLSRLLGDALAQAPARRQAWLDRLPTVHDPMRPVLERLLAPRRRGASATLPLELPAIGCAPERPEFGRAGQRVGPYTLLKRIGAGGTAVVWSAAGPDPEDRRRLALKLPRYGEQDADRGEIFMFEGGLLVRLSHPNIVRFRDAGYSQRGLPYVATELIAGRPITEWCRANRVAREKRLTLFLQLLAAVRHAHEAGVVHHDLKPDNVLVDRFARAHLIDFGIARPVSGPEARGGHPARRAFTPGYASPEQLNGEPATRQSDVYALGMLLHRLVFGARSRPPGAPDLPGPPGPQLKGMAGALGSIVARATAGSPADRYPDIDSLADALRRRCRAGRAAIEVTDPRRGSAPD